MNFKKTWLNLGVVLYIFLFISFFLQPVKVSFVEYLSIITIIINFIYAIVTLFIYIYKKANKSK